MRSARVHIRHSDWPPSRRTTKSYTNHAFCLSPTHKNRLATAYSNFARFFQRVIQQDGNQADKRQAPQSRKRHDPFSRRQPDLLASEIQPHVLPVDVRRGHCSCTCTGKQKRPQPVVCRFSMMVVDVLGNGNATRRHTPDPAVNEG